ncbi:hypothetical protein OAR09_00410 [bacterium]|nr:hypothetical protein [bacterium]
MKAASKIDESISKLVKHGVNSAIHTDLSNFDIPNCNKNIILITQYHKSLNKDRDLEIIESINNNIKNPLINEIFLFTENVSEENIKKIFVDFNKIKVIPKEPRLNYKMVFNFIKNNYYNNNNNIYLLCNSDCYFDESLKTLKYINFQERPSPLFLTMTRYEHTNGKLDVGKNPFVESWSEEDFKNKKITNEEYAQLPYLEPWSSDAWAFKFNSIKLIEDKLDDFSQHLGTNLCEILLVDKLIKLGVECKNIGLAGYVKCIHNHKSLYREKHNIKNFIENKIPGFVPDPSRGVIRTKDNSINNCWRLISKHNWLDEPRKEHRYSNFFLRNIFDFLYKKKEKYKEDLVALQVDPIHRPKFKDGFGKIVASKRRADLKKNFHTDLNSKPFNFKNFPDKHKYITLITQFYPEENKARFNEIVTAIQYNINNPYIDEIILLVQYDKSDIESINSFKSLFYNTDKVNFVIDEKRLTYSQAITYAKIHNNQDSLYFIINNDCFFDERIKIVKKINMLDGKRLLCFTRKDMNKNGIITHAIEPKVGNPITKYQFNTEFEIDFQTKLEEKDTIDIASQDAWGFSLNYDPDFDFDIALGTFNCEAEFTILNHMAGFTLSNLIKYCPCIHLHNTNLRKESAVDNNYFNPLYKTDITIDNYINGTWRRRVPENYIDKNSVYQEYTDFLVLDFKKLL